MARATWNGVTIAESPTYELVEGNVYFPATAVNPKFLKPSGTRTICRGRVRRITTRCRWMGRRTATRPGSIPIPSRRPANIKDHVAFWRGVTVER